MPASDASTHSGFHEESSGRRSNILFVVMILGALVAFEIFNFSTTDHALTDLLGNLSFLGVLPWSTVLAFAFCGIDFAGIARLFTPEQGMGDEPKEVWYLFAAWLLAATMNAILTWWGVAMAVAQHSATSTAIVDQQTINSIVPVFVAIMVWVIRILIIGTLSMAMDRLLHPGAHRAAAQSNANRVSRGAAQSAVIPASLSAPVPSVRPAVSRPSASALNGGSRVRFNRSTTPDEMEEELEYVPEPTFHGHAEPSYHTLSPMSARPASRGSNSGARENSGPSRTGSGHYRRS
jgi:hypothetical protein